MVRLKAREILNEYGFHIGETILKNDKNTFLHTHDFFEIFIIKEGEVYHNINEKQILLGTDSLWLVMPEDVHQFKKGNCRKADFVNIAFSSEVFERVRRICQECFADTDRKQNVITHLPAGLSRSILSKISFLIQGKVSLFPIPRTDILVSILLDCLMALNYPRSQELLVPVWLEHACSEIRRKENYLNGMQRFVQLSGRSKEHLSRCMKKYYNMTPGEYLNGIKLEQVALLLETTDETVLNIMLECGFNNVSYFNQLFKKEYGITPSRYRMRNRSIVNPE